ncbi:MAG: hypothetical protein M1832_001991 [Thelocarpon impressellum]|nr:MAG: hypothetical protein M1832_001991 [Thelocarpon impressellum]
MLQLLPGLLLLSITGSLVLASLPPVLHFTLERRGGSFPTDQIANMTFLTEELRAAEARFNLTRREMNGNKVVRKAKERAEGGGEYGLLMGDVGRNGSWYAKLKLGVPEQTVHMDLDMLTTDFFLFTTTSSHGSQFFDFNSQTYRKSGERPYPTCDFSTDNIHMPTIGTSTALSFAHCRPPKSSLNTLRASGSMLGLAPSESLSQTNTPSLTSQLYEKGVIARDVWSLMLINGKEGVFSVGGTGAEAVELVQQQTEEELKRWGELEKANALDGRSGASDGINKRTDEGRSGKDRPPEWEHGWRWNKVQGARGWWQILMQGVWVDGTKVLKNQPIIIDFNTPFVLAPPLAAKAFYSSISGARPMPAPHDQFYLFPCLNPPTFAFEFSGWPFPAFQGGKGADYWGGPGGRFSLGKVRQGSGYCVGAVVETRMGVEDGGDRVARSGRGQARGGAMDAGNGLRDVWVLGEGFFRGVSGVFDPKGQRVGFRTH